MTQNSPYDRRLIGWLSVGQLISWGSVFYLFSLIMPIVERDLQLSRAEASIAFGLALLTEGALAFLVGRLIDKGHERLVMTFGSIMLSLCLFLLSFVSSAAQFYAVWIGLGVGMACCLYAPVFAVATRRFPLDYRRAIITLTFLGGLASTVFIPLMAWLFSAFGWRTGVVILASMHLFICLPIHLYWLRDAPKRALANPAETAAPLTTLHSHLSSPQFVWFAVFIVLMMGVTSSLPAHMISLLRERQLSEFWVIAIPASIGLLQVFGRLLLYFFEHRIHIDLINRFVPSFLPMGLLCLIAATMLANSNGTLALILICLFVLLWGMGNGMLTIVKGTAVAQYISREHVASLNGALGLPQAISRAMSPVALGLMWSQTWGYAIGLWVMLVICVLGITALSMAIRLAKPN